MTHRDGSRMLNRIHDMSQEQESVHAHMLSGSSWPPILVKRRGTDPWPSDPRLHRSVSTMGVTGCHSNDKISLGLFWASFTLQQISELHMILSVDCLKLSGQWACRELGVWPWGLRFTSQVSERLLSSRVLEWSHVALILRGDVKILSL